ncbi:SRPBCC family protein [Qipengyuania sp. XHP0211]|uniref:SRPBCC family protein n=1 Tax=Qipengyuania sp. XHP0211 TaxID=3038079 RepID=UPI00241C9F79|nr:SRPBCC family protein [Qipengyuania sp. XHP0211]MDG5749792.1 SRPBCC family protein [Qipengyuania sp. XHP0211]
MHELSITRRINAAPEKVWDVLANRQEEWWCPKPWTIEMVAQERRPGGRSAMIMRGPDGEEIPQEGIFLAWDEGRRFVTTDAVKSDFEPSDPFMIGIWVIEADGDGTRYTARARHWTEEAMKQHADMGFEEGWSACADQLKALCEAD